MNEGESPDTSSVVEPRQTSEPGRTRPFLILTGYRQWLVLLSAGLLVFVIYSNVLHSPFVFDDLPNIQDNPHIRLTSLGLEELIAAGTKSLCSTRPVSNVSFALNYYFHGYRVAGYHIVNIIVHLLTGVFLFLLIKTTLVLARVRSTSPLASAVSSPSLVAMAAALVWLAHPIHTQSVTYIVQRMNSISAMFFLLCMLLFVQGRLAAGNAGRWGCWSGSFLAGVLAVGSKENAAMLPFFIFLYEWYFFQDLNTEWLKRQFFKLAVIAIVFVFLALVFVGTNPLEFLQGYKVRDFTLLQRVLTEFRVLILYIGLLILPYPAWLNLDYDFPLSYSLVDPVTTLLSLAAVAGLLVFGIYWARKDRLVSFVVLWFFGNLFIESSVIPLELVYEHRTYLPSTFVVLLGVLLVYRFLKPQWARVGLLCVVVAVFSLWTYERNHVWKDRLTLWQDCASKSPNKARVVNNLGLSLFEAQQVDEAIHNFARALDLDPSRSDIYVNMGNALSVEKRYQEAQQYYMRALRLSGEKLGAYEGLGLVFEKLEMQGEALKCFSIILQKDPEHERAHNHLGKMLARQEQMEPAIRHLSKAIQINPNYYEPYNNMGNVLLMQGKLDEAARYYSRAIQVNPDFADAYNNLGSVLMKQGKIDDAVARISTALRIDPDFGKAHMSMALAMHEKKDESKAVFHLKESLRTNPDNRNALSMLTAIGSRKDLEDVAIIQAQEALKRDTGNSALHIRLADLYTAVGDYANALAHYTQAVKINPDSLQAFNSLTMFHALQGDYGQALESLEQMARISPDNPGIYYNMACLYAKQNMVDESVRWLQKAIDTGFDNWSLLKSDQDLANIRETDFYQELVARN